MIKLLKQQIEKVTANKKSHVWLFLLLMAAMTAVMMFFYRPLCPGGDLFVHLNRLHIMIGSIRQGTFPWYLDYVVLDGYGYFLKAFYCDVIFMPFALIGLFTDAIFAYQSMLFTITVLCGLLMYVAVKRVFGSSFAGSVAGLLYAFAVYRLVDIYIRSAMGETIALTFIPIAFWGIYEIIFGNYKKWYVLALGMTFLLFSHVISTVLITVLLLLLSLVFVKRFIREPARAAYLALAAVTTLVLSAYYLYPMLEQMAANTYYYQSNPIVTHLWVLRFHEVVTGMFNQVSLRSEDFFPKIGVLFIIFISLRLFVKERSRKVMMADVMTITGLVLLVMVSNLFPWGLFPFNRLGSFIQFTWRLYGFCGFFFAVGGGYYIASILRNNQSRQLITLAALSLIFILTFNSDSIHYKDHICNKNGPLFTEPVKTFRALIGAEYLPARVPSNNFVYDRGIDVPNNFIDDHGDSVHYANRDTRITNFSKSKGLVQFHVNLQQAESLEMPLTYYKGYSAEIDGQPLVIEQSEYGLIQIPVNKSGDVKVHYAGTVVQKVSTWLTLLGFVAILVYIFIPRRKKGKASAN